MCGESWGELHLVHSIQIRLPHPIHIIIIIIITSKWFSEGLIIDLDNSRLIAVMVIMYSDVFAFWGLC